MNNGKANAHRSACEPRKVGLRPRPAEEGGGRPVGQDVHQGLYEEVPVKNLHAITAQSQRPSLTDLYFGPAPEWQQAWLRRNMLFPNPGGRVEFIGRTPDGSPHQDPAFRVETIAQRLARRVAELRYHNRNTDDLALVLTPAEADAYDAWLLSPSFTPTGHYGLHYFEGVRLVRA